MTQKLCREFAQWVSVIGWPPKLRTFPRNASLALPLGALGMTARQILIYLIFFIITFYLFFNHFCCIIFFLLVFFLCFYFSAGEVWFTDPACRYELNSTSLKLSTEFLGFENIRKFSETSLRLCEHSLTHCFAEFINDDVIVINPSWCWWWFMIPKLCVCKVCGYASTSS